MPYENASSRYWWNCLLVAWLGYSGSSRPLPTSSPTQSFCPTTTSGAASGLTVSSSVRMAAKSCTEIATGALPHAVALFAIDGCSALLTQITSGAAVVARCAAVIGETATSVAEATASSSVETRPMRVFTMLLAALRPPEIRPEAYPSAWLPPARLGDGSVRVRQLWRKLTGREHALADRLVERGRVNQLNDKTLVGFQQAHR